MESLFRPSLAGKAREGLAKGIKSSWDAARRTNDALQALSSEILIFGGMGSIPGLRGRLEMELFNEFPMGRRINCHFFPEDDKHHQVYIGMNGLAADDDNLMCCALMREQCKDLHSTVVSLEEAVAF